ncbi:MAG: hypothetical protein HY238_04855, partial [Acidobacteria bacterium]|nr:hypothetical protein [Acidobacteriota bacterium]
MSAVEENPISDQIIDSHDEIHRAITLLFQPSDVVEVRVPKAGRKRTISGYYSDLDQLASAVVRLEANDWPGVYWTLNPVNPALLARANNKLKSFAEVTTSDADVLSRRWLPIDLDPRRPSGISASDTEHEAALGLAQSIRRELLAEGWPEPIVADSGNGAHLLYRVDLPNDAEASDLIKRSLEALSARFSTEAVTVDVTTYNASRIFKAYCTTARKGDSTEERPHRLSRILDVPAAVAVVPVDLLSKLAAQAPAKAAGRVLRMPQRQVFGSFDIEQFLGRHGVPFRPPVPYDGGRKFVLEECPWDPTHRAPDAAVFEGADGRLGFRCFHNSCQGRGWREFRSRLESVDRSSILSQFAAPGACPDSAENLNPERTAATAGRQDAGTEASASRVEENVPSIFQNIAPYPAPLSEDAYYGIAGRFVRLVEPHTEADSSFLLIQFLAYAGNIMGRRAFIWAGADRHYSNLFICGVGPTSTGRKGSAAGQSQLFFRDIDEDWVRSIQSGLSSGEGLIWCVRDPIYRREKVSQGKGKPAEYEDVLVDPGVEDKRLLVQQSEFFGALQAMRRQGNNLSPTMRDAFDKGHLNSMVKNSPAKATDAHVTIVGNITKEELLRGMLVDEMDNGFANRFL